MRIGRLLKDILEEMKGPSVKTNMWKIDAYGILLNYLTESR